MSKKADPNNYCVYVHVVPNGKLYIGITGLKLEERWNHGRGYSACPLFRKAIEKYGWDEIQHIVLIENVTQEVAGICERALIEKYRTNEPEYGYNLSGGGERGNFGYKFTDEQRRRMSETAKGRKLSEETKKKIGRANSIALKGRTLSPEMRKKISEHNAKPFLGKHHTEEAKRKNALAHMGNQYHLGIKHSEETRQKMSEAKRGKPLSEAQKAQLDRLHELMRNRRLSCENI